MQLPPRRRLLKGLVVLLLLVVAGAFAADRLLSKEEQRELQAQARILVRKGVEGVSAVIDPGAPARPEALSDASPAGGARAGARASLPDEDKLEREARAGGRRRERVTITLHSRPPGAEVRGPRGLVGTTPVQWSARVGASQSLTFRKDGYAPLVRKVTADRNETTLTVELQPSATSPPPAH
jgi:hypothetical protein